MLWRNVGEFDAEIIVAVVFLQDVYNRAHNTNYLVLNGQFKFQCSARGKRFIGFKEETTFTNLLGQPYAFAM